MTSRIAEPVDLPGDWPRVLSAFAATQDYKQFLDKAMDEVRRMEQSGAVVLPPEPLRFAAFDLVQPEDVRVVILGQDPYPTPGDAMGLSFSVPRERELPRSLVNIFRELGSDLGCPAPTTGDLRPWARQGVLLLNTILTVTSRLPKSHRGVGWQHVTERVVKAICMWKRGVVFILWGNDARLFEPMLLEMGQVVISSSHPSPMGGSCFKGFYGSRPFSKCNKELRSIGEPEVDWRLT